MTEHPIIDLAERLATAPDGAVFTDVLGRGRGATITLFSVPAHHDIPPHVNPNEAVAFLLDGSASVTIGDEERVVEHGTSVRFPPGVRHGLSAGADGFQMLLVVAGAAR